MDVVVESAALGAWTNALRARGGRVGFVPTMGALHEGHLALVREARRHADAVVVSIFVNPLQFGPSEDLARYPRDLDADVRLLAPEGAALVFAPTVDAMYPRGSATRVRVERLTETLCGPHRPGHFEGVTTVCARLFGLVGPCVAVFGRKDYQQWKVVARMARDLALPVEVVGHPTVREPDGLARSSRNAYLSADDRRRAAAISAGLAAAWDAFAAGERRAGTLRAHAAAPIGAVADAVDYVAVADAEELSLLADDARARDRVLVAVAARLGRTRLIDNVVLGEDERPVVRFQMVPGTSR